MTNSDLTKVGDFLSDLNYAFDPLLVLSKDDKWREFNQNHRLFEKIMVELEVDLNWLKTAYDNGYSSQSFISQINDINEKYNAGGDRGTDSSITLITGVNFRTSLAIFRNLNRLAEYLTEHESTDKASNDWSDETKKEYKKYIANAFRNFNNFRDYCANDYAKFCKAYEDAIKRVPKQQAVSVREAKELQSSNPVPVNNNLIKTSVIKSRVMETEPLVRQLPGNIIIKTDIEQGSVTTPESGSFLIQTGIARNKAQFFNTVGGFVDLSDYLNEPVYAKVEAMIKWSLTVDGEIEGNVDTFTNTVINSTVKEIENFRFIDIVDDFGKSPYDVITLQDKLIDADLKKHVMNELLNKTVIAGIKGLNAETSNGNDILVIKKSDQAPATMSPWQLLVLFWKKMMGED